MAILRYRDESGQEEVVHVGPDRPTVLIGRSKECDLRTKNPTVSRRHAAIRYENGRYILEDLQSANGTLCRNQRVIQIELLNGDVIQCGTFTVEFSLDSSDLPPEELPPPLPFERTQERPPTQDVAPLRPVESPVASSLTGRTTLDYGERVSEGPKQRPVVQPPKGAITIGVDETPRDDFRRFEEAVGGLDEEVQFRPQTPKAEPLIAEEREREGREKALLQRLESLEALLRERDETIRRMGAQIEDLNRVIARFEAQGENSELRVADLERVLAKSEAERASLEEELEATKAALAEARAHLEDSRAKEEALMVEVGHLRSEKEKLVAEVEGLNQRIEELLGKVEELERHARTSEEERAKVKALEEEIEMARAREKELAEEVRRLETEKGALEEEMQRWEGLKKKFEEERTQHRLEAEELRKQVAELSAKAASLAASAERADQLAQEVQALSQELAEVKLANRSYLKRISKLLEELEAAKAPSSGPDEGTLLALKAENERLREEVARLEGEVTSRKAQLDRALERLATFEGSGSPLSDEMLKSVSRFIERINDLISEGRTALEVLRGLIPELGAKFSGSKDSEELVAQIESSAEDLMRCVQEMKREALEARGILKRTGP